MSTLGELINRLAIQGGIDQNDEALKGLLTNTAVSGLTIDDKIVSAIDSNLLTVESAKNNPTLKNHFTALALNGVDLELKRLYEANELESSIVDEINAEQSSYKRIGLLIDKVKTLESAKASANKDGKEKLNGEIEKLNQQINDIQSDHANELNAMKTNHRNDIKNMLVKNMLGSYDYSLPTSKDVSIITAENIINNELAKRGGLVIIDDNNNLQLKQSENPELDFYVNNEKVDYKGFADSTLANHKLLKTVDTPPANQPPTPPANMPPAPGGSNAFAESIAQNIDNLESANK